MRTAGLILILARVLHAQQGPTISLLDTTMRVDGSVVSALGQLRIKADKLSGKGCTATASDWAGETAPGFSIAFMPSLEAVQTQGSSYFLLKATVKGLPPNTNLQRYLRFACGEDGNLLSFTVTNKRKSTITLVVTSPTKPYQLLYQRLVTLAVKATGDGVLTNPSVSNSTLVDESTGVRLGKEFLRLCLQPPVNGTCQPPTSIATDTPQSVILEVLPGFASDGQFKGNVFITGDQLVEAASFELAINATSYPAWVLGAVFLLLGTSISWYLSVYTRSKVARAEALLPVAALAETLDSLQQQLEQAGTVATVAVDDLVSRIVAIRKQLSEENLDGQKLLPPVLPNPFSSAVAGDALKQFLAPLAARSAQFVILTSGIQRAATRLRSDTPAEVQAAIRGAITTLCQADPKTDAEATELVKTELQKIDQAAQPAQGGLPGLQARGIRPSALDIDIALPTRAQLLFRVSRLVGGVWLLWGILTVVTGFGALILVNPAFGVPADYLKCLLWGIGVQMAGQQLQQLGPGSVSTALGISIPKTS